MGARCPGGNAAAPESQGWEVGTSVGRLGGVLRVGEFVGVAEEPLEVPRYGGACPDSHSPRAQHRAGERPPTPSTRPLGKFMLSSRAKEGILRVFVCSRDAAEKTLRRGFPFMRGLGASGCWGGLGVPLPCPLPGGHQPGGRHATACSQICRTCSVIGVPPKNSKNCSPGFGL